MRLLIPLAGAALLAAAAGHARPVTYPGGSMSMTEVDGSTVTTQVDHTLNPKLAVGAFAMSENGGDRLATGLVANYLLMRRNTADSQANAYILTGIGPSWSRDASGRRGGADVAGWVAAEADWETRRLFFGGMAKASFVGDDTEIGYRLRAGVAPYVANTGALHTWLFLQVGRTPIPGRGTEVTPLVRLFKGPVLAEAGVSHRGRAFGTLWFYF